MTKLDIHRNKITHQPRYPTGHEFGNTHYRREQTARTLAPNRQNFLVHFFQSYLFQFKNTVLKINHFFPLFFFKTLDKIHMKNQYFLFSTKNSPKHLHLHRTVSHRARPRSLFLLYSSKLLTVFQPATSVQRTPQNTARIFLDKFILRLYLTAFSSIFHSEKRPVFDSNEREIKFRIIQKALKYRILSKFHRNSTKISIKYSTGIPQISQNLLKISFKFWSKFYISLNFSSILLNLPNKQYCQFHLPRQTQSDRQNASDHQNSLLQLQALVCSLLFQSL